MANIKQQKKRVGISARQRLENLRFRSSVKTHTKRLRSAVEEGESAAARKKSQAAKLVAGKR
jgi:ribosomal protein S20